MKDQTHLPIEAATLRLTVAISAGALIAFGAICWVAANWADFHRLTKLEMAAGPLLAAALVAAGFSRAKIPALLVAVAAVGGLLALIGQTYPSGADAWQLFALWAALALPFALAARHDSVWSLWAVVASAGIALWRVQEHSGGAPSEWLPACLMAIALAALLSPWTPLQRVTGRSVWAFRLAALGAIGLIGWAGIEGVVQWRGADSASLGAALGLLAALIVVLALLRPTELGVMALAAFAVDALLVAWFGRLIAPRSSDVGSALVLALIAAGVVAASVAGLREIARRARPALEAAAATGTDEQSFSWPLAALSGFGAVIAALPMLLLFGALFGRFIETTRGAGTVGALTLAAAILILRGGRPFGFRQMFGMIAAFAGLGLLAYATERGFDKDFGLVLCLIATATAFAIPARGARAVFGFLAAVALIVWTFERLGWRDGGWPVVATALIAAGGALALALPALGRIAADRLAPFHAFALGWTSAGLGALVLLAGRPFLLGAGVRLFDVVGAGRPGLQLSAQAASIGLALAGGALLFRQRADLRTPLGIAVAAAALALSASSPTLGAALFILACALLAAERALSIAAALATIWIVSALYYSLAWTLAQKGYGLMALGALLGGVLLATRRPAGAAAAPNRGLAAPALIALGLAATAAVAGPAVRSAEEILAHGREIFIALRPVDPRSLVQGDYMAIAFDTARLGSPQDAGEVLALATVDPRSIATLDRLIAPGVAPAADQIVVKLRRKSDRWFVGSDAYFFAEGRGKDYEGAKYGAFRVGADGRLLLTGLTDAELKRLP